MSIYQGSRYEYSTIDFISVYQDGDENPIVFYEFPNIETITYSEYIWQERDRLDLVSYNFYRKTDLWWYILDNNPEIEDPSNIPAGTVLRIPRV
jgi:hypothetical protein